MCLLVVCKNRTVPPPRLELGTPEWKSRILTHRLWRLGRHQPLWCRMCSSLQEYTLGRKKNAVFLVVYHPTVERLMGICQYLHYCSLGTNLGNRTPDYCSSHSRVTTNTKLVSSTTGGDWTHVSSGYKPDAFTTWLPLLGPPTGTRTLYLWSTIKDDNPFTMKG